MTMVSKVKVNIYLNPVLWLVARIPLFFLDRERSYLAHVLPTECRMQQRLQINAMTMESKVKVKYRNSNSSCILDRGASYFVK